MEEIPCERKISLGEIQKLIILPDNYSAFLYKIDSLFNGSLPEYLAIFYLDSEGDVISVQNEEDYEIALSEQYSDSFEIILKSGKLDIKPLIEALKASSLHEEKKVRLLDQVIAAESSYIPEEASKTEIKEEFVKPITKEDEDICISCQGTAKNHKGEPCKKCHGTGKINSHLKKFISKIIQKTVAEEVARSSQIQIDKSQSETVSKLVSASKILDLVVKCTNCGVIIREGCVIYSCSQCNGFYLCEDCEEELDHPHALLRFRRAGTIPPFRMKIIATKFGPERCMLPRTDIPHFIDTQIWTIINSGKVEWPYDTALYYIVPGKSPLLVQKIGPLGPSKKINLIVYQEYPIKDGTYPYVYCILTDKFQIGENLKFAIRIVSSPEILAHEICSQLKQQGKMPAKLEKNFLKIMEFAPHSDPQTILTKLNQMTPDEVIKSEIIGL